MTETDDELDLEVPYYVKYSKGSSHYLIIKYLNKNPATRRQIREDTGIEERCVKNTVNELRNRGIILNFNLRGPAYILGPWAGKQVLYLRNQEKYIAEKIAERLPPEKKSSAIRTLKYILPKEEKTKEIISTLQKLIEVKEKSSKFLY